MSCSARPSKLIHNRKGFSLLEVLISICLLSIAMLAVATVQSSSIRSNDLGNRTSQAIALAQDKLEQLISSSTGNIVTPGKTGDSNNPVDETGRTGGPFTRTWMISSRGTPVKNAQEIDVTVEWSDIFGNHVVTVRGVITPDAY